MQQTHGVSYVISSVEIISLFLCFITSAFFSGSEAVLMSIGVDRAKQLMEEGGVKANALKYSIENSNAILTTILIGNNVVNIFIASLATQITVRIFHSDALGISVGVTTILLLFFGEILPKTFARNHAEMLSVFVIRVLQVSYYLLYPAVTLITWFIETLLGENAQLSGKIVTQSDIEYMIARAEKEKSMDSRQLEMLNSILEFPTIKVKDIMIPRPEVRFVEKSWSLDRILRYVQKDSYSRYPVCTDELEETVGILHVKDLAGVSNTKGIHFKKILKDAFFIYEHMKIQAVLEYMKKRKIHFALVKDENGIVVGIVTLEDIIEEILGEIHDEHDVEEDVRRPQSEDDFDISEGVSVEGSISIRELYQDYDIKIPQNDNYSTLAGFLLGLLGNTFPSEGQIIVWNGLSFQLEDVDEYEIKLVLVKSVKGDKYLFYKGDEEN